jgi:phosphoribosyl-AMP cyclohydrolase
MFEQVKWDERGLVPTIVQDVNTHQVLMMAYMSSESFRNELWHKGATSGNVQRVSEISVDCDGDTLLIKVEPAGPACHTGAVSCFFDALKVSD